MGQKTNPIGLRIALNKDWRSKWYADKKQYAAFVYEDYKIRKAVKKRKGWDNASIAKIDIEGAETELFSQSTVWIDHFPLVIVELHDWMMPGQARSRAFLQAISSRDRDFVQIRENSFSIRNDPVAA